MPGAEVEKLVAEIASPVMAVGEDLRVLALSPGLGRTVGLNSSSAIGRRCYEAVQLLDTATGRACADGCPLATGATARSWAHSGVLELVRQDEIPARLDRLLSRCLLADASTANLCFLRTPDSESYSRVLRAIEAVYPLTSRTGGQAEVLPQVLDEVLGVTSAVAAEVLLADSDSGEIGVAASSGLPIEAIGDFRRSAVGHRFQRLVSDSPIPLLAAGHWSSDESTTEPGWYLSAPLVIARRVVGVLGIASRRDGFDIVTAMRVMFAVAAQLAAYLGKLSANERGIAVQAEPSAGVAPRLRLYCMGRFQVVVDGEEVPVSRFRRSKAVTLLKYLAAHRGKRIHREALMELLWPGADPAASRVNLRVVLHDLRRALGAGGANGRLSLVGSHDDLVSLDPSDFVWVDAEHLDRRAQRAAQLTAEGRSGEALEAYRDAGSLYAGEFLEDEPYVDWCLFERERLKEVYLNILRQTASLLVDVGEVEEAIECHRKALQVDRGREEVHRLLIGLLWKAGRRDEAIRQYERCRRVLWEELEAEPAPETEAARLAMREGSVSID